MEPLGLGEVLPALLEAEQRGEPAVVATVITSSHQQIAPGSRLLVRESGETIGTIYPPLQTVLVRSALDALEHKKSGMRSYRLSADGAEEVGIQGGEVDIYFDVMARHARLVIVGAGHVALPLARFAALLDFEVVVLDDRPEFANRERFPDAQDIRIGDYAMLLAAVDINSDTHIVLVTRGHVHDQACLELVLRSPAAYIGMIGSKYRVRTVMKHLKAEGFEDESLQRVFAPIGIDIGSQTPAEIALAIMAEIVNLRRNGSAPSLALKERLRV